ncbi:MAG TPA: 3-hydroxyacyl-CoA dehydrogenase NAD-binding domain-containing protein [Terriglobales bacterium]|nr:3-hydroxyacyl-CoA dehydrogenase NAD-binding domain-containing protein [Terriglobales bacterium]
MKRIHKVAVLGAGTMGARIAAHFANAGVPSYLLDMVPPDADKPMRNKIAAGGLEAAKKSKPAAFFDPSLANLVTVGNFEDDLKKVAEVDWIIEAVVENLEIKRDLLKKVEAVRRPGTIITTNTSGLPVAKISEGFPDDFRRCWFGTHFFNPPRYMRLLELIPTPETDRALLESVEWFADVRLGKGVVRAKETPNFIANRIGTFSVLNVMRLMQEMDLTIEEVDALTGQAVGWPRSATFRTIDLVGLDILGHVVGNMSKLGGEEAALGLPEFFKEMLSRKWLGDKTKGGFYKKTKGGDGEEERLALNWKTLEYHPRQKPKFPALDMAKNLEEIGPRLRMLLGLERGGSQKVDKAGAFLWAALRDLWNYSADRIPEIADSIVEIDRAMRLGFNWELGPFELWDAAGVEETVARMHKEGRRISANAEKLLGSGKKSWYVDQANTPSGRDYWKLNEAEYVPVQVPSGVWSVTVAKKSKGVVKKNSGASLVDLGDGVGCVEFHSKMNSLGADIISLITQTLKPGGIGDNFDAFVVTNDAANFSVGANLMLLLMSVQEQEWDEVDLVIRQFQGMTQAIKFSPKPVVVAPFGMTLGGGAEITLHAPARQPHAELYIGLVEVGVGLLPGGGGCKEMLLRAIDGATALKQGTRSSPGNLADSVELLETMKKAFETIATAKVATSAHEAREFGFLLNGDGITMNRERVLADAKSRALELVRAGYEPAVPRNSIPAPGESILATLKMGVHLMRQGEYITEYEVKLGHTIAEVLCGGNVTPGTPMGEQYVLDLEREAFKSLCGERKTQERIQYTLKTGKTLRN